MHGKGTKVPSLRGTGDRDGNGKLTMYAVTGDKEFLPTRPDHASAALILGITVTNLCEPGLLDKAAEKQGRRVEVAGSWRERTKRHS